MSSRIRTDVLELNMGPQHPSTHGVLRLGLKIDGEVVLECDPDVGYLHRGIEKLAELRTYIQFIPITDRLDYLASMLQNQAYIGAVEKLGADRGSRAGGVDSHDNGGAAEGREPFGILRGDGPGPRRDHAVPVCVPRAGGYTRYLRNGLRGQADVTTTSGPEAYPANCLAGSMRRSGPTSRSSARSCGNTMTCSPTTRYSSPALAMLAIYRAKMPSITP